MTYNETASPVQNFCTAGGALVETAKKLLAGGYQPVACHGKAPIFSGWQRGGVSAETIRSWESDRRVTGIGILCGRVIGLDIDILDAALSERVKNLALQMLGNTDLVRIGLAPKQLLTYQVAAPIRKKLIVGVIDVHKDHHDKHNQHRVEVLAEGQQFVAYGRHPDTLQPYAHPEKSLADVPVSEVPLVTEEALDAFLVALRPILGPAPNLRPTPSVAPSSPYVNGHHSLTDREDALEALYAIPGDLDYDSWIKVGFALYAALGYSGASHWESWSARSSKNVPATTLRKWPGFANNQHIHAETLFWMAREHGWKPARERDRPIADLAIFKPVMPRHDPETGEVLEEARPGTSDALPLLFWNELGKVTPPDRLIKRLLGMTSLAEIFGAPGCGKSFLAMDMGVHIALGRDWFGRPVTPGAVIHVAAEGVAGIHNRLAAFKARHSPGADVPFAVIPAAVDLGPGGRDAERVIVAAREVAARTGLPLLLVIIDTLARSMGAGDENATKDMSAFIAACDRIRIATGATVLIVHHSGKDETRGGRGSTALYGAIDTEIKVEKRDTGRAATVTKQKDGAEGETIGFDLEVVEVGTDDDGEPITTCVVVPIDGEAPKARRREPRGTSGIVLRALIRAIDDAGEPAPASAHIPSGVRVVSPETWRGYAYQMMTDKEQEARKKAFQRASTALVNEGHVAIWNAHVWLTSRDIRGTRRGTDRDTSGHSDGWMGGQNGTSP